MPMEKFERQALRKKHDLEQGRAYFRDLIQNDPEEFMRVFKAVEEVAAGNASRNNQPVTNLAKCFLLSLAIENRRDKPNDDD